MLIIFGTYILMAFMQQVIDGKLLLYKQHIFMQVSWGRRVLLVGGKTDPSNDKVSGLCQLFISTNFH